MNKPSWDEVPPEAFQRSADSRAERALVHLDSDRRIASWSRVAERITGFIATDAIGRPWSDLCPSLRSGQRQRCELKRKDGATVVVDVVDFPLAWEDVP